MGLRVDLDRCGKSRPHQDSIPGPSSPYSVAIPTTLPCPLPDNGHMINNFKTSYYRSYFGEGGGAKWGINIRLIRMVMVQ